MSSGVEVKANRLIGDGNILQVLHISDEEERNFRREALQNAFFEDLSQIQQPTVLLLDTFETAPTGLRSWLSLRFLPEITQLEHFTVVIAGQKTPDPHPEWRRFHHRVDLLPILDADTWHRYFTYQGMPFKLEEMGLLIEYLGGNPAQVVNAFEGLERQR